MYYHSSSVCLLGPLCKVFNYQPRQVCTLLIEQYESRGGRSTPPILGRTQRSPEPRSRCTNIIMGLPLMFLNAAMLYNLLMLPPILQASLLQQQQEEEEE